MTKEKPKNNSQLLRDSEDLDWTLFLTISTNSVMFFYLIESVGPFLFSAERNAGGLYSLFFGLLLLQLDQEDLGLGLGFLFLRIPSLSPFDLC